MDAEQVGEFMAKLIVSREATRMTFDAAEEILLEAWKENTQLKEDNQRLRRQVAERENQT